MELVYTTKQPEQAVPERAHTSPSHRDGKETQLDDTWTLCAPDPGFVDAANFLCAPKYDQMSCPSHGTRAYCKHHSEWGADASPPLADSLPATERKSPSKLQPLLAGAGCPKRAVVWPGLPFLSTAA